MTRYPVNGTFELTLRCNLRCKMCMLRRSDQDSACLQAEELTADQWIHMAEQAAQAGTLSLLLTGGEPMLRKDFTEIYQGIYAQGFLLSLYTNATMVTPQVMQTLTKLPPHRIGVTLYGADNADYEKVCGCPDGFDRAMDGLEKLLTLPSVTEVRFTPTKDTIGKLKQLDKFIFEKFGKHVVLSSRVFRAVRGGCMSPEHCRPTAEQVVDATWGQIESRVRETIPAHLRQKLQVKIFEHCSITGGEASLLGCNAGMDNYTISYNGKLLGCQLLDVFRTDALQEGLLPAFTRYPETVVLPEHPCKKCRHLESCTLCPAVAMAETGSLTGVPEYICQITKLTQKRKEEFTL